MHTHAHIHTYIHTGTHTHTPLPFAYIKVALGDRVGDGKQIDKCDLFLRIEYAGVSGRHILYLFVVHLVIVYNTLLYFRNGLYQTTH